MMERIELLQLEAWINQLRSKQPPGADELSAPLAVLAELYGRMIYARLSSVELGALTEMQRRLLRALAADATAAGQT